MMRGVSEELADKIHALVVGDVGCGLLAERLAVKILCRFVSEKMMREGIV